MYKIKKKKLISGYQDLEGHFLKIESIKKKIQVLKKKQK
jgi:hypothetical protein